MVWFIQERQNKHLILSLYLLACKPWHPKWFPNRQSVFTSPGPINSRRAHKWDDESTLDDPEALLKMETAIQPGPPECEALAYPSSLAGCALLAQVSVFSSGDGPLLPLGVFALLRSNLSLGFIHFNSPQLNFLSIALGKSTQPILSKYEAGQAHSVKLNSKDKSITPTRSACLGTFV